MYNFSYFKEKDQSKILDFVKGHPFAFLTGSTLSGKQVATQIPILVEEREGELFLQGHIMRKTDHHKAFAENPPKLPPVTPTASTLRIDLANLVIILLFNIT